MIIAALVAKTWDSLPVFFAQAGAASLLLNILGMILGFVIAKSVLKTEEEITTICIEIGLQNGTTALFITSTLLNNPTMSIAPSVYSLIMFVTGASFAVLRAKQYAVGISKSS